MKRSWRRIVLALVTPATFALLLYTVGAPHTHGG